MDDEEQSITEEVNQPLLITNTETHRIPKLESSNNQTNISQWSPLFKLSLAITVIIICVICVSLIIWITPIPPSVQVHSMQISLIDHNLSVWSATFSIKNPNKKLKVTYENPSVWLVHRNRHVATVNADSFGQKGGEENEVVVKGEETTRGIDEEKALEIEMVFLGRVGFYPGASDLWGEENMTAVCENVGAKLSKVVDGKTYDGTNVSVLSFDGRLDCRVHLPIYP